MLSAIFFLIILGFSYAFGSICSAVIVCSLCKLPDPRVEGSKNPGATNVLRISGKKYAAVVLLADVLKGLIPVVLAKMFGLSPMSVGLIGFAAVIGHAYPLFFDFKGGKGVATMFGVLLGMSFMLGLVCFVLWFLIALISRYSSLAAIITFLAAPIFAIGYNPNFSSFSPILLASLFVVYRHKNNFERLQNGTESKIAF
ncbi:MAG: acyl-phosphate glycerol 3-phosphate acyltransferase [Legionellales bacterium RIFCSPHIGHO2_12_FULL_42_9]|nr:MAG: acyl-phosphate glycerol 3-phosphate acyltransferase [Legionellales bacterium RIFCSPHIGHO2_12_FULL_42_9]